MSHAGAQEYFQIECRTGCPGVFSNLMSHAGVQEYFQIECRTRGQGADNFLIEGRIRGSRSGFKLNVSCGDQRVFPMLYTGVKEN